jgi:hypothetical protein
MTGSELLDWARHLHPEAKRGLLIPRGRWGDRATGDAIFESIAHGRIDHHVLRPFALPGPRGGGDAERARAPPDRDRRRRGDGWLDHLVLRDRAQGGEETVAADGLFVIIGARPHTDWLPPELERDAQGFVLTGTDLRDEGTWPLDRTPFALETSMPGVFAAGDARHGSVKRVASAVGEGSIAIQLLHRLFAADRLQPRGRPKEPAAVGR